MTIAGAQAGSGVGKQDRDTAVTQNDAVAKPAGRRAMGLRWKRSRVGAEVLEMMRAEMRRALRHGWRGKKKGKKKQNETLASVNR